MIIPFTKDGWKMIDFLLKWSLVRGHLSIFGRVYRKTTEPSPFPCAWRASWGVSSFQGRAFAWTTPQSCDKKMMEHDPDVQKNWDEYLKWRVQFVEENSMTVCSIGDWCDRKLSTKNCKKPEIHTIYTTEVFHGRIHTWPSQISIGQNPGGSEKAKKTWENTHSNQLPKLLHKWLE